MQSTDATILSHAHLTLLPTHQAEFGFHGVELFIRHPSPLVTAQHSTVEDPQAQISDQR
jgi:hypothetical protein